MNFSAFMSIHFYYLLFFLKNGNFKTGIMYLDPFSLQFFSQSSKKDLRNCDDSKKLISFEKRQIFEFYDKEAVS